MAGGALGIALGPPTLSEDEAPEAPPSAEGDEKEMSGPKARVRRAVRRLFDAYRSNDVNAGADALAQAFDGCMDYDSDDEDPEADVAEGP
jgi:hypothetical protein